MPAAQSAVLGESRALLHVWVDAGPEASGRPVDDPTHQLTVQIIYIYIIYKKMRIFNTFVTCPGTGYVYRNIRNQNRQKVPESSSQPSVNQLM